jgi:hypothetical protein
MTLSFSKLDHRQNEVLTIGKDTQRNDSPVLQSITDQTLRPWLIHLKGTSNAEYAFFEMNVLPLKSIKNGIDKCDCDRFKMTI